MVFYIDGTREAARQRALPQTPDRPPPARRLGAVCARGYTGRKRGELVRTRTTVLQAHRSQWLGTFGNAGNGQYREELHRAVATIQRYAKAHMWPVERMLVRLDGQYRTGAVLAELAGLAYVMRGKDYQLLDRPEIQHASTYLPISSSVVRKVAWCARPTIALTWRLGQRGSAAGSWSASQKKPRVGVRRAGLVYEFFLTCLPQAAFTTANVVALYLHRGAFENALADEDLQQDPDRWCSHAPGGQEAWQIISQWVWNVRLELGHHLEPTALRTTEFAPALPPAQEHAAPPASYAPAKGPCPSNRAASGDVTLSSNQMVPCVARLGRRSLRPKRVVRGMLAYGWCMQRASVNVEAARCASSASGMAVPR